jgi:zinc-ribbon family/Tellurite resistance protein TerB
MIIWGWRVRFKKLGEGIFFCPNCGGDRHYTVKQGRRWFTLFFIPIIPLDHVGEPFVECAMCRQAFRERVLAMPTSAMLANDIVTVLRESIVWIVREARGASPARVDTALQVLSQAGGRQWTVEELRADFEQLDLSGLGDRLARLSQALNEQGRESVLSSCARVAAADGILADKEREVLDRLAAGLAMTPAHAHGVISQVTSQVNR